MTTTVNLASALAADGRDVLVIDLDPQGNVSTAFEAALGLDPAIVGADRAMYKGRSSGVGTLGLDYRL